MLHLKGFSGNITASQIRKSLYVGAPMKMIILGVVVLAAFALTGMAADAGKKGSIKHVVAFKFKDGASKADIEKVEMAFKDLKKKIKVIRDFETGTNISPENLNKGFTHGWILTFANEKDRDTYLKHPDHEAFATLAKSMIADGFVIDFRSEK